MDKKKKKYIVLTIIAVLLIGLLILINVIGAGTKSASAEEATKNIDEITDISQLFPDDNSNYKYYNIYLTTDNKFVISWFLSDTIGQIYGFQDRLETNTSSDFSSSKKYVFQFDQILEIYQHVVSMEEILYQGMNVNETIVDLPVTLSNNAYSSSPYDSIESLITDIALKKINYTLSSEIVKRIRWITPQTSYTNLQNFDDTLMYSNYDELQAFTLLEENDVFTVYPQATEDRLMDLISAELKKLNSAYDDGYNEATDRIWFGIFTDAVIEKIYKPNTWEDTSTDIIFTTYGISFDNAFAKIEEYRKTNQTPDTEAFYIQLKFSKPFKFQNDNDFYAKLYTNKKVMQSWFESETGRQIFITTDEEPNPNGFGYRIKTSEDLPEPITVQRLIICYTPYYKDTLASDFVDLGTGTNATEYNNGYVTGKNEGFENGYAQGKNDGYQNGYSAGLIEGQGPTNSIQKLIASVQAALNVDLFGSISLQDILNVMIAIFFVLIALKLFAGG